MILNIIRWIITLTVFAVEWVLKGLSFIVLIVLTILYGIFMPIAKLVFSNPKKWFIYTYSTTLIDSFYITEKVWDLWDIV